MNDDTSLLIYWFGRYLVQMPALLVALAGCLVVLARRRQAPRGSTWALLGFGLAVVLGLIIPVGEVMSQRWMMESHETRAEVGYVLTSLSLLWNTLHAVVYVLLLVAVFAGRSIPPLPVVPLPLPRSGDGRLA